MKILKHSVLDCYCFIIIVALLACCCSTQGKKFKEANLTSNMIATSKQILVGQTGNEQPVLKSINLLTLKMETIKLKLIDDHWLIGREIILADLKNGQIAFAQGNYVMLIDNATLQVKSTFKGGISDIKFYNDQKTGQSKFFIRRWQIYYQVSKNQNGSYYEIPRFATSKRPSTITFTGLSKAVFVDFCYIQYWTNFYSIVDRQTDKKYYMKGKNGVAVGFNETYFVLKSDQGYYEFYNFSEDYDVTLKTSVFVGYNQHRKGQPTSDDKIIFVSQKNPRDKHNIAKIDFVKGDFELLLDSDGSSDNQIDFVLFAAKYDRMVTLVMRNKKYYLQLRSISSLSIIHEHLLVFDFPILEYKLVGSSEWGLSFALGLRVFQYDYRLQHQSKLYSFSAEGDKVVQQNFPPINVTMSSLGPCYKYIVSYKGGFPTIKLFHYSNLSLAGQLPTYSQNDQPILIQKSTLMVRTSVYDLRQSFSSKGYFQKQINAQIAMIFPYRGIIYYAFVGSYTSNYTIFKDIYNISSPVITSSIAIDSPRCGDSIIYYIQPEGKDCNSVFFIDYDFFQTKKIQITKYQECTKKQFKYPVQGFDYEVSSWIYISSDQKYIIVVAHDIYNKKQKYLLQIRPISQLEKVIYREFIDLEEQEYYQLRLLHFDFVNDSIIVVQSENYVYVIPTNNRKQEKDGYLRAQLDREAII